MLQRARHRKFYIHWIFIIDNLWIIWQAVLFFLLSPDTIRWQKITAQISAAINSVPKKQNKTNQQKSVKHNDPCATNRKMGCLCDLPEQCLSPACLCCTLQTFPSSRGWQAGTGWLCHVCHGWALPAAPLQPYGVGCDHTVNPMHSWCIPHKRKKPKPVSVVHTETVRGRWQLH